jgi:hypothetical protein
VTLCISETIVLEYMDLNTLSLIELKALAYDNLAQLEIAQTNLRAINKAMEALVAKSNQPNQPQRIDPLPPGSIQAA